MATLEFFKKTMDSDIKISKPKFVVPPKKWVFSVTVQFDDKVFKEVKDDSVLLKEMNQAADKVYDQTCLMIRKKLDSFEDLAQIMFWKGAQPSDIKAQLDGLNKALEQDKEVAEKGAEVAVKDVWKSYASKKKEYLKYKLKIGASITGSLAGLATSIGLMATGPFTGGAGGVLGVVGMIKSVVQIGKEIGSAAMDMEKASKVLEAQLAVVEKAARSLIATKANEYTGIVAQQFLGISQPTIQNCRAQMDTIEKKLSGIEIKIHKASKELNACLDEQEAVKNDFMEEVKLRLNKHPLERAKEQVNPIWKDLNKVFEPYVTAVNEAIAKVDDLHKRWEEAEGVFKDLQKRVEKVSDLQTVDETILRNAIVLVDLPISILNGNAISKDSGDLVSGLVPTLVGLKYDKITSKVLEGTLLE